MSIRSIKGYIYRTASGNVEEINGEAWAEKVVFYETDPLLDPLVHEGYLTRDEIIYSTGDYKESVIVATDAALPACVYDNGINGVGATLTAAANGNLNLVGIDGIVTLVAGNRVLVKDQVLPLQNGIYDITRIGSVTLTWIMTRSIDADLGLKFGTGSTVYAESGTVGGQHEFILGTLGDIEIGTTALSFFVANESTGDQMIFNEIPTPAPDGSNSDFTVVNACQLGKAMVFKNGLLQGDSVDYTQGGVDNNVFSFSVPPLPGDRLRVTYLI